MNHQEIAAALRAGKKVDGWHLHKNGGGLVQDTATVDATACVGPDALVCDSARVCGSARVCDSALVCGSAWVYDSARVCGSARVCDSALVYGSAWVYDSARVCDSARVYDSAQVCGSAWVCGSARVCDSAQVCGSARVASPLDLIYVSFGRYGVTAYRDKDGIAWMRYGCELHQLKDWPKLHLKLAKSHMPDEATTYSKITREAARFVTKMLPKAKKEKRK